MFLVSACLLGLETRYDLKTKSDPKILKLAKGQLLVPICPEQLGGLPTPRPPAQIIGGNGLDVLMGTASVVDEDGRDVTREFIRGAQQVLRIARLLDIEKAYLKAKSPSCGYRMVLGVTAALLVSSGISVVEID